MATIFGTDMEIDVAAAASLHDAGTARILDIREDDEWRAGRIDGALHIPVAQLGSRLAELGHGGTWLAICRSGSRADRVTGFLREAGLDVRKVTGGMRAWADAGLPFAAADGGPGEVL
jgi:rhodanese-related sulfurtransferase